MKLITLLLAFQVALAASAQNTAVLVKEAADLEKSMQDPQALARYKEALALDPSNVTLLCKCSEISSRIGSRLIDNPESCSGYFRDAKSYATQALAVDPRSSEANFSMALAISNEATQLGGKEKLEAVRNIKKYADLSIFFDQHNYKAWYILGKWNYAMSSLNFMQKAAVKMFFSGFPP
ncbi:MAG: hypothetical protein KGM98_02375, partial [Bacteroidota bacterium]|nr:hypothetical protein [Bacteroidota bacterium]